MPLSLQNKEVIEALSSSTCSQKISFKTSKTGKIVPILLRNNRNYALHSLFDPEKEGKSYSKHTGGGFVVVFGLGAGYHIKELLKRDDINGLLIIEKNISIIKSILSKIDLSEIFSDPRLSIIVDKSIEYILDYLPKHYIPAISGDFHTISLRSRIESDKIYFNLVFDSMKTVLNTLSDDYTVQTWFGKRWFINTIANLAVSEKSKVVLSPQKKISIVAAGPSLELFINRIKKEKNDSFLISTDTALATLLKNSILPDLVISIDCQQITYHHFMAGYPKDVPLLIDLASPPVLSNISNKTMFFTSGHPFSQYLNRNWRKFPFVDTSGGNVTHAAISLAEKLGAEEIYLYGADFSYPEGKTYSRGTYIYPYFHTKANRTKSIETLFYDFLYRNENISMVKTDFGFRYVTRQMLSYKERLERLSFQLNSKIIPVHGIGERINIDYSNFEKKTTKNLFSAGKTTCSWTLFLKNYLKALNELKVPDVPPIRYFSFLNYKEKDIWTSLFPVTAAIRKNKKNQAIKSSELLNEVKTWAIEIVKRHLE